MPVVINKKAAGAAPNSETKKPTGGAGAPSFIMTGDTAKKALKEEEAKAELARDQAGKPRNFYIHKDNLGKDYDITFLDGDLDKNGEIQMNSWSEHFRQVGGKWRSFVCLQPGYCANCAADDKPTMVCAFTVVDHSEYTVQKGPNEGKTFKDQKKLFMAKRGTLAQLQKIASMRNGLRGVRITATRTTANAAQVGDMLIPLDGKYDDNELFEMLGKDDKGNRNDLPFNYAEAAPYYTAEELKNLGIGSASNIIGKEQGEDLSHKL